MGDKGVVKVEKPGEPISVEHREAAVDNQRVAALRQILKSLLVEGLAL